MMDIDDDNDDDDDNDALSSFHSTPPSIRDDCLIDLSVGNNNNDEGGGGGINIRHSYGYNNKNNINLDFPLPNSGGSSSTCSSDNDNGNNNTDSFNAVVAITPRATTYEMNNNHFLWMRTNHDPYVPDEVIILSNDDDIADRNSVHDELLTGDGDVDVDGRHHRQYHEQGGDSPPGGIEDEEKLLFRPPTLMERPKAISYGDRVTTPTNSWQSSTKNALLSIRHRPSPISMRTRTRSGSNSYSVPMSPASKHSRKSTKSEKYYHSYVTDPTTPQRPVPPFVVIHNRGHAIVKVTSKGTTTVVKSKSKLRSKSKSPSKDSNNNEGDKCECSPKPWCHQWGRSVAISLTVATLILALVTVVSSLIADQQENDQQQQQQQQQTNPTISPSTADNDTINPSNSFPMSAPTNNNNNNNNNELLLPVDADDDMNSDADNTVDMIDDKFFDGTIVKVPYEETQNPASANNLRPTPVPRTHPPNYFAPTVTPTTILPPSIRRPSTMTITTSAPTQQQQLQELQFLPTNFPISVPTDLPFLIDDENMDDELDAYVEDDDNDNDNDTSDDELESIPWNNYVIGLLSIKSPDTIIQFDDPSSPQFMALQWISVDAARKGGSTTYSMDASLQRYALATLYFALGGNGNGNSNAAGLSSTLTSSSSSSSYSSLWTNDDAWLSTVVNVCDWYGITCDSSETAVLGIDMSSNGLEGTLPIELKLLKYLQTVTLPNNSISGTLPLEYSDLNELVELNLANNYIEGEFPWQYGGFGSGLDILKILDLHGNKLNGSIPSTIGNMLNLEYINLCSNLLEGTIPSTIGSLFNLQSLKLGNNNKLYGNVPDEICDMGSGNITNLLGGDNNGDDDDRSSVSVSLLLALPDIIVDCTIECKCCDQCCNGGCGDSSDNSGSSDGKSNDDDDACCVLVVP